MNFIKVGKFIKDHIPEILTGVSVGCTVASNYLTADAAKKEAEDGNKKHYIPGMVVAGVGAGAAIGSNLVSSSQNVALAATTAGLAGVAIKQRKAMNKNFTDEEIVEFDELKEFNAYAEGGPSGRTLYYMPTFGIKFWSTKEMIDRAEIQADKFFTTDGQVGLDDILEFLKAYNKVNEIAAQGIRWSYDWDSDEEQHIIFRTYPSVLCDVSCTQLFISQTGTDKTFD